MIGSQFTQMHAQARHEPVEDQFEKRHQQHQFDGVLKEERLLAHLSRNPLYSRGRCHAVSPVKTVNYTDQRKSWSTPVLRNASPARRALLPPSPAQCRVTRLPSSN